MGATTGGFRNVASADHGTSADALATQSSRVDRALPVRRSGSFGDPGTWGSTTATYAFGSALDTGTILEAPGPLTRAALANAVRTGRGGRLHPASRRPHALDDLAVPRDERGIVSMVSTAVGTFSIPGCLNGRRAHAGRAQSLRRRYFCAVGTAFADEFVG